MKTDPCRCGHGRFGGSAVVGGGLRDAAEVAAFEPVAVALERDDGGVVDQPVDHGRGDHGVAEDLAPAIWGWVMFVVEDPGSCLQSSPSSAFLDFPGVSHICLAPP